MALEDEIMARAAVSQVRRGPVGWLHRLSEEHRAAASKVKENWRAMGGTSSGVTANSVASSIAHTFAGLGYTMPRPKEIANWLMS